MPLGQGGMWNVAADIGTALALAAFVTAAVLFGFLSANRRRRGGLATAPPEQRLAMLSRLEDAFDVPIDTLSEEAKLELGRQILAQREMRFRTLSRSTMLVAVLLGAVVIAAMFVDGNHDGRDVEGGTARPHTAVTPTSTDPALQVETITDAGFPTLRHSKAVPSAAREHPSAPGDGSTCTPTSCRARYVMATLVGIVANRGTGGGRSEITLSAFFVADPEVGTWIQGARTP